MLFLLILALSLVFQFFLPWWSIVPLAFALSLWKSKSGKNAFFSGFLAIAGGWIFVSLFKSVPNEHMLANKIGQMLGLPASPFNWIAIVLLTAIIGGLAGGLSALAGYYWKVALQKNLSREVQPAD